GPPGPPTPPDDDGPTQPPDDGEDGDDGASGPPTPTPLDDDSSSVPSAQTPGSGTPSRTPGNGRPDANDDLGAFDENGEETDDGGEDDGRNILPLSATVASVVKKDAAGPASVVVDVLHNDSAFGGKLEPSTVTIVTPPLHGLALANPDGSVIYVPGSNAVDTFQYTVQDDRGRTSNVATVTILPRNADGDACWSAPRGQIVTGLLPAGASMLNGPVLYRLVADAHNGTVAIVDPISGRFKYTPHAGASADSFTYEVVNGAGVERHTATVVFRSRIMALGGVTTAGLIDTRRQLPPPAQRVGYRQPLYELLTTDGYAVDFVGSRSLGFGVEGFDADNEAHPGWTATELAYGERGNGSDGIYGWLTAHPADIVLLQINPGQTDGAAGVEAIFKEIDRWEASPGGNPITVVLAEVPAKASGESNIRAFNRGLETIVTRRTADLINGPDDIVVIDDYRALVYPADFHDPVHPNRAGYRKMAQTWRDALVEHGLLSKCP
ncbi:MAG TPA: Ig-like domain-containing protein, partial [Gammaproteobacteria bacterium]|nr:Ig-like domain-containing protein [Gammaproteobacteria bacterium]